jgi:cyanophycin synthetase
MLQITTRLIAEEAARRGWKVEALDERFLSTLAITTPDGRTHYFDSAQPPLQSAAAVLIADNKLATYLIARRLDIPVAAFMMHDPAEPERSLAFLDEQAKAGHEIVVKPDDTNHGDGITVGVTTREGLREALGYAQKFSNKVLLQRRYFGADYRVLVVDGKVIASARRHPAFVVGDGKHTVKELIDQKNADPARGTGHSAALTRIDTTSAKRHLGDRFTSVPAKGEYVTVIATANLSKGGEAEDITDTLHPTFADAALRIAAALDMYLCGVDFLAGDHTKPLSSAAATLVEINATPGLRMHHFPTKGVPRRAAAAILDGLSKRMPGTNGEKVIQRR